MFANLQLLIKSPVTKPMLQHDFKISLKVVRTSPGGSRRERGLGAQPLGEQAGEQTTSSGFGFAQAVQPPQGPDNALHSLRSQELRRWAEEQKKKPRLELRINWYSLNGTSEFTAAFTFGGNCQGAHKRRNDEYSGCLLNPLGYRG